MSTLIICAGISAPLARGNYDSAGFDAAVRDAVNSPCLPYGGRKYGAEGKTVLIGEGLSARDTAEKLLLPCEISEEPLLNEIPLRSFSDTERRYPRQLWLMKAAAQRRRGNIRQAESDAAAAARADKLIDRISDGDYILVTYPRFLTVFLDRLRVHDYVVQRTGFGRIKPLERFLISQKESHCGGCQHNCFLSNPGCGVGRDKAMRKGLPYSEK